MSEKFETTMEKVDALAQDVCVVRGHVETMNSEMGELRDEQRQQRDLLTGIQVRNAHMEEQLNWLTKFFWIVVTATVGSLGASILNLVVR